MAIPSPLAARAATPGDREKNVGRADSDAPAVPSSTRSLVACFALERPTSLALR